MRIENKSIESVSVPLSVDELRIINNSLNEVCNALHVHEFETRMGATIEETRELLAGINNLLRNNAG